MKRVFLPAWILAALAGAAASGLAGKPEDGLVPVILVGMALFGFLSLRWAWSLADSVHDGGDELEVRRGPAKLRIPYGSLGEVGYIPGNGVFPSRITLEAPLATCPWRIVFVPHNAIPFASGHPLAEELRGRIAAARTQGQRT